MNSENLSDWLQFIESFHPADIALGLARIKQVADKLGLTQQNGKVILVAGTNGKGSCVAMLDALAMSHELKVGCYTSPHLLKFNERIRLNGNNVDDQRLVHAFQQIESVRGDVPLTFFEFTTLAALFVFKQQPLDLVVLEVGLGGREDATNIVPPDACIITTIDIDHVDWLGDDLAAIAYQKGGIIRDGVDAYVGDQQSLQLLRQVLPEFIEVLKLAPVADKALAAAISDSQINRYRLLSQNIMLARSAFESCLGLPCSANLMAHALQNIQFTGRFQQLDDHPMTLLDVAHNAQSAANLAIQLADFKIARGIERVVAICGMMADKDIKAVLTQLAPVIDEWCLVDLAMPRAIKAEALQLQLNGMLPEAKSRCFNSVASAYQEVENETKISPSDLIMVFGSFITVANMLQYAEQRQITEKGSLAQE